MTMDVYEFEQQQGEFEQKVWGSVLHLFHSPHAAVSWLKLYRGFQCSKHLHQDRLNMFLVMSGSLLVQSWMEDGGVVNNLLKKGETLTVPAGRKHRFIVVESGEAIEIYWPVPGKTVRMDDIVRDDVGGPAKE